MMVERENEQEVPEWTKDQFMANLFDKPKIDKNWRPKNWLQIKKRILEATPVIFSPSTGWSKDQKEQIMEKTASAILEALGGLDAGTDKE